MPKTDFCADRLPAPARLPAWRCALTNFAIDPRVADSACFRGRVEGFQSPRGIGFSILESGPQRLAPLAGRADEVFWLAMFMEGQSAIELGDAPVELAPGDILFGKRGAAGALDARTWFRMLNVTIPADLLARSSLVPLPARLMRLQAGTGSNRVLGGLLSGIAASIRNLDDGGSFAVEAALVQLVINSLFDGTGAVPLGGLASARAALLRRIWQSIETRLHDSGLALADIAAEHRLSVRYIQQLFEENGQSFRTYVRRRRLERCGSDLANSLNANVSITAICLHWGFGDSASFSRAFREAHDCTPSAFRRRALRGRHDPKRRLGGVTLGSA